MKEMDRPSYKGYWPVGGILVVAALFTWAITTSTFSSSTSSPSKSPGNVTDHPIPTSIPEAKTYISRASDQAKQGDYVGAESTLQEAIKLFPNDQNLALTLEYYENQAAQKNR